MGSPGDKVHTLQFTGRFAHSEKEGPRAETDRRAQQLPSTSRVQRSREKPISINYDFIQKGQPGELRSDRVSSAPC